MSHITLMGIEKYGAMCSVLLSFQSMFHEEKLEKHLCCKGASLPGKDERTLHHQPIALGA